ncbi:MAG: NAD-glutamate dehydrogenase domain-containing protein [Acidimicrobiales bacterium]
MTDLADTEGDGAGTAPSRWAEELASGLGGDDPQGRATSFAARSPASYRDQTSPAEAALDVSELEALAAVAAGAGDAGATASGDAFGGRHRLLVRPSRDDECTFRIRRYGQSGIELTQFLPVLESFGLVVVESVPHRIGAGTGGEPAAHIDDVGVRIEAPDGREALRFAPTIHGPRLVAALEAVARGDTEVDSLNRLVTVAGLDWRQVTVLRAYLRYWLQGGTAFSGTALADPLVAFPDVARSLVGYFEARFDPQAAGVPGTAATAATAATAPSAPQVNERARCLAGLDLVPQLEQDQVLRGFLSLIDATLRTNYFQRDESGGHRPVLVLKLDSHLVPELPNPRPQVEAFVHGPAMEGIHLRAGMIARGGLRWSERPSDFRTEVLDLAFAQVKKNAIIVPTGAKGGFVCRAGKRRTTPARPGPDRVRAAYEAFVRGLLDVTDNVVAGEVVTPAGIVAHDGPDPYLVVAADKGTATFSDVANAVSEEYGFWLGDAFASGGSRGYDHKAMGITARGAWVAVRRHFHQLGMDVQSDPIRVVGVGDMSGDVFGNGMLCSEAILLVAAFDHRHVFLDPTPDPAASYTERRRLAALPSSSWADYRSEVISAGGGVWPRDTKKIPLAPAARRAIGLEVDSLSPPALISAILSAPVDLVWFGGIGTYVKAPDEPDAEVGDHANDALRVTSDRVRARVIAEGANLGITQRARIHYSRRGGRINADFIDNAAGVATSDREVNLKILLALAIEEGRLDPADRDSYLSRSADEVAGEVLRQVDHSVTALTRAVAASARELDAYEALIDVLEEAGRFDRSVECLPAAEEIHVRRAAGAGLIRPELAVLLAYTKSDLVAAIEGTALPEEGSLRAAVVPYFPGPIRDGFADLIPRHRLYQQLVATDLAGEIVDLLGIVWAYETAAELGVGLAEVASAFWAARQVIGAGELWNEIEVSSPGLSADAEGALHTSVSSAVAGLARSYLAQPGQFDLGRTIARDSAIADELATTAPGGTAARKRQEDALLALGVSPALVSRIVTGAARSAVGDVAPVSLATSRPPAEVAEALSLLDRAASLEDLVAGVTRALDVTPPPSRLSAWQGRALVDDVADWRRAATAEVLRAGGSPRAAVAGWEVGREAALGRAARLLSALDGPAADPLAVAALVVRRLHLAL